MEAGEGRAGVPATLHDGVAVMRKWGLGHDVGIFDVVDDGVGDTE